MEALLSTVTVGPKSDVDTSLMGIASAVPILFIEEKSENRPR
jgi:hypothetical protein